MTYRDRRAAGVQLARRLRRYAGRADVVVLGMVRGGVPVAVMVADRLSLPLDVLIVRKLGVPWAPEVAFGALGSGGVRVLDQRVVTRLDPSAVRTVLRRELAELGRREQQYRGGRPPLDLAGRTAIVVDDGLATGASATAAIAAVRRMGGATVVLAVPVGAREAVRSLAAVADDVVCPLVPTDFGAVSRYYDDFRQVDDDEVVALLATGPP
jgi:putative phosphoribosyl transferase